MIRKLSASTSLRIVSRVALVCALFVVQLFAMPSTSRPEPLNAQGISYLFSPYLHAISPRVLKLGSPDTTLQMIASVYGSENPTTETEVLFGDAPLSTTLVSGVYQAIVPASLLTEARIVTVSMRIKDTLTGDASVPSIPLPLVISDTFYQPVYLPAISAQIGEWSTTWDLKNMYTRLGISITDHFGLPLGNAPIVVSMDAHANGYRWQQNYVVTTDANGRVNPLVYIDTRQITQTITPTVNITLTSIFFGEVATQSLESTLVVQRYLNYFPFYARQYPLPNHDDCTPVYLTYATPSYMRPANMPQDVYIAYPYQVTDPQPLPLNAPQDFERLTKTMIPDDAPRISPQVTTTQAIAPLNLPRGIQISNYKASGMLELYSIQQNRCYYESIVSKKLLARISIPPIAQQPFQWCPPEATWDLYNPGLWYQYNSGLMVIVRNLDGRTFDPYTITANFPYTSIVTSTLALCNP